MEPLTHEGLARLLQIDGSLQTPHVISREDLTDSQALKLPSSTSGQL